MFSMKTKQTRKQITSWNVHTATEHDSRWVLALNNTGDQRLYVPSEGHNIMLMSRGWACVLHIFNKTLMIPHVIALRWKLQRPFSQHAPHSNLRVPSIWKKECVLATPTKNCFWRHNQNVTELTTRLSFTVWTAEPTTNNRNSFWFGSPKRTLGIDGNVNATFYPTSPPPFPATAML